MHIQTKAPKMADSSGEDAAVAAYFLLKLRKKEEKPPSIGVGHRYNHHIDR